MVALLKLQEKSLHLRSRGWKNGNFLILIFFCLNIQFWGQNTHISSFFYTENTARWLKLNIFLGLKYYVLWLRILLGQPTNILGLTAKLKNILVFKSLHHASAGLTHITERTRVPEDIYCCCGYVYNKLSPQYCSSAHTEIWNVNIAVNSLPIIAMS